MSPAFPLYAVIFGACKLGVNQAWSGPFGGVGGVVLVDGWGWGLFGFRGGFGLLPGTAGDGEEVIDCGHDGFGLVVEFSGGCGAFFCGGGVALGDLVHFGDGAIDLGDSVTLFLGGRGDFCDQFIDFTDLADDVVEGGSDGLADFDALLGVGDGGFNFGGGFAGGGGGSLGEVADFFCDDGEAHAGFAGSGSFDGGIEGEEVGLEGDFVDGFEDAGDIVARVFDGIHGVGHGLHFVRALVGSLSGGACEFRCLLCMGGVALRHAGHFLERGTGFFEGGCLFAGAFGE
ncbi:MAG: hypothetical protein RI897_152 [Verrucomicrobiota bacterium]